MEAKADEIETQVKMLNHGFFMLLIKSVTKALSPLGHILTF